VNPFDPSNSDYELRDGYVYLSDAVYERFKKSLAELASCLEGLCEDLVKLGEQSDPQIIEAEIVGEDWRAAEDTPLGYWVYADPMSGRYFCSKDGRLVAFGCETGGRYFEALVPALQNCIGHSLMSHEVGELLMSGEYKAPLMMIEEWDSPHAIASALSDISA
jgi:hypothetical protein